MNLLDKRLWKKMEDKSLLFGRQYTDFDGSRWELSSQNDLNIPYFYKVIDGITRKDKVLYCINNYESLIGIG